ncbi:hypothetical protein LA06_04910 [Xanthomonas oryzae pv. oryzae]|nr:hypothetical protein ACU13_12990 [Xanthomonas oryzae pv. oryzicola]AKO16488.1 hypothetical protein ACU12_12975 [Xanthomonas oryzae pv. oryzicola]PNR43236.1 hypothetical protein LA06_04910 [Xanthomonas oryzae pv. oryzae]
MIIKIIVLFEVDRIVCRHHYALSQFAAIALILVAGLRTVRLAGFHAWFGFCVWLHAQGILELAPDLADRGAAQRICL